MKVVDDGVRDDGKKKRKKAGDGAVSTEKSHGDHCDEESNSQMKLPVPLFQLEKGVADDSYGIHCAIACGVDRVVTDRAMEVINMITT